MGLVSSLESLGWKNALESLGGLRYYPWKPWLDKRSGSPIIVGVELLVLEALVGTNTMEPYNNLNRDESMMVVIYDHEAESFHDG